MDIRRMKLLDEFFGPPICLIFHFYNSLKKSFTKYKLEPAKVNNILLIKFFGMGSILLAGPMIRALKNKFPNARIIILTFLGNYELCQRIKSIDEVIYVETSSLYKFITSLIRAILRIRKKHCEISIDLEFFAKSSTLIQYLCATRIRVGYYLIQIGIFIKMMWRGNLLTHQVYYNPHKHTSEAFLALARAIDADTNDLSPTEINIFADDIEKINYIFMNKKIRGANFLVAININSGPLCLERRWPLKNFVDLVDKLQQYEMIKIIIIGDKGDIDYTKLFLMHLNSKNNIIDLTGKLDIGMLLALLLKVRLLITNDSGPMHMAASLGTPVAAFFGPETPERFGPWGGEKHTVFYHDIYCSPCLNVYNQKTAPCNGNNRCMIISPEEVYNRIKEKYLNGL